MGTKIKKFAILSEIQHRLSLPLALGVLFISLLVSLNAYAAEGNTTGENSAPGEIDAGSPEQPVQASVGEPETVVSSPAGEVVPVPPQLATPLKCYQAYIEAMLRASRDDDASALNDAVMCLDLSSINKFIRKERGTELVVLLARILDYSPPIDINSIPDTPDAPSVTLLQLDQGSITLSRGADHAWRFNRDTVAAIPGIFRHYELSGAFDAINTARSINELLSSGNVAKELGIRGMIPTEWKRVTFLIEDWQWFFLVSLFLLGYLFYVLVPLIVSGILWLWLRKLIKDHDNKKLIISTSRPWGLLGLAVAWWLILVKSGIDPNVLGILLVTSKILTAIAILWIFYQAVDIITEYIKYKSSLIGRTLDPSLVSFISGALKVTATFIGLVLVVSNMGVNVAGLVAGLGIGGLVIALAAQESLSNLIGSLVIFMDKPFKVGDYVVIGTLDGIVESTGFRSTKIRTFYNSLVTVPNGELTKVHIDNMGVRQYRRVKTKISVIYGTPPCKMEAFCAGIRELIRVHPYTLKDNYFAWFDDFAPASLDIQIICHLQAPDFATERRERHRLFLDIIRLAQSLGIVFAFPTQTIFMGQETPAEPIFPASGDISSSVKHSIIEAEKAARDIAFSELGGKDVFPLPFSNESDSYDYIEGILSDEDEPEITL